VIVDSFIINKEGKEVLVKRELRFIDSFRFMASKRFIKESRYGTMYKYE